MQDHAARHARADLEEAVRVGQEQDHLAAAPRRPRRTRRRRRSAPRAARPGRSCGSCRARPCRPRPPPWRPPTRRRSAMLPMASDREERDPEGDHQVAHHRAQAGAAAAAAAAGCSTVTPSSAARSPGRRRRGGRPAAAVAAAPLGLGEVLPGLGPRDLRRDDAALAVGRRHPVARRVDDGRVQVPRVRRSHQLRVRHDRRRPRYAAQRLHDVGRHLGGLGRRCRPRWRGPRAASSATSAIAIRASARRRGEDGLLRPGRNRGNGGVLRSSSTKALTEVRRRGAPGSSPIGGLRTGVEARGRRRARAV